MSIPEWVDEHMPPRGPCLLCGGPDARHRVLDAISARIEGGEAAREVADDYGLPIRFVGHIAREWPTEVDR